MDKKLIAQSAKMEKLLKNLAAAALFGLATTTPNAKTLTGESRLEKIALIAML